jgi:hypothetical protein
MAVAQSGSGFLGVDLFNFGVNTDLQMCEFYSEKVQVYTRCYGCFHNSVVMNVKENDEETCFSLVGQ